MQNLAFFGLIERKGNATPPNVLRSELRLTSGEFVAWVQADERESGELRVVGTNTQIVYRKELCPEGIAAIKEWMALQLNAVL